MKLGIKVDKTGKNDEFRKKRNHIERYAKLSMDYFMRRVMHHSRSKVCRFFLVVTDSTLCRLAMLK